MSTRFFVGWLLAACMAGAPVAAFADSIDISCGGGCPLGIPNAIGDTDSVVNEATTGTITDVDVFVEITYPFMQNLTIQLLHAGQAITLFDQIFSPGPFADLIVIFDDEAATSIITQVAPFVGVFQPAPGALSILDGLELSGDWTLRVESNAVAGVAGNLVDWIATVQFTPSGGGSAPIPGTLALFGAAALGGLGFGRRRPHASS